MEQILRCYVKHYKTLLSLLRNQIEGGLLFEFASVGLCTCSVFWGHRVPAHLLRWRLAPSAGEAAQDAPLGHLQTGRHRRDSRQHIGQSCHIRLHVTQKFLKLVQHCKSVITHTDTHHFRNIMCFTQVNTPPVFAHVLSSVSGVSLDEKVF